MKKFSALSTITFSMIYNSMLAQTVFAPPTSIQVPENSFVLSTEVDDADNDGDMDIFLGATGSHPVILLRNEEGIFSDPVPVAEINLGFPGNGFIANDFDQDGDADIFMAIPTLFRFEFLRNSGEGMLEPFFGQDSTG